MNESNYEISSEQKASSKKYGIRPKKFKVMKEG